MPDPSAAALVCPGEGNKTLENSCYNLKDDILPAGGKRQ
jgi:hypothetical protein